MSCRTGCPTKDHASYAECLRASGTRVAYSNSANGYDYTKQKRWDRELADYRAARAEGIEPRGTDRASIDHALRMSDKLQKPFDGHTHSLSE